MTTIRLANFSPSPFRGWKRLKTDFPLPHAAQVLGGLLVVRGEPSGLDTHYADVRCLLGPGEETTLHATQATPVGFQRGSFPQDPLGFFGGQLTIDGNNAKWVSLRANGAGYDCVLRQRESGEVKHRSVEIMFTWYPTTPWLAEGEIIVTNSNPATTALVMVGDDIGVRFGDAVVLPLGGRAWKPASAGTQWADGQARAMPVLFVWLQHMTPEAWSDIAALAQFGISAVGIQKLLADGNPLFPQGFDPRRWTKDRLPEAMRRLHTWEPPMCGPAPQSSQSGEQDDQPCARGEAMLPDGLGAEKVIYLSALKMANRPCHHLEADGSQLDPARHTAKPLIFFNGRPHTGLWNIVDRLGKDSGLAHSQVPGGWFGPDEEHAMHGTLAAACRMVPSHACQWLLRQQAIQYPLMWTTTPGWSTSQCYAARAVGWEALLVVHIWRELEDRALAQKVRDHYMVRLSNILLPTLGSAENDIWDVRVDDPRLGPGRRWIPWQSALGAYGLDLAGEVFGRADARIVALRAAQRVLNAAWKKVGTRWVCCPSGLQAVAEPQSDAWSVFNDEFSHYGMPGAPCVVLRQPAPISQLDHEKSTAILAQVRAAATLPKHLSWVAPGVLS